MQHEVTVIALPSSVKQEDGKGKGKPREKDDQRHDVSKGRFKFALIETVALVVHEGVAYEHVKDLPARTKDGPRGAAGTISFTLQNSKDRLLKAAKEKKSSLNGDIAGFHVGFEDPLNEAHDKYEGYTK